MRRLVLLILLTIVPSFLPSPAHAATPTPITTHPSVKAVALTFGRAVQHNDGATAHALLAPGLRGRTPVNRIPSLLGVTAPPTGVRVVRWAYNGQLGDATLGLEYGGRTVAEHLYLRLFGEGWRITNIVPENHLTLQRGAETAVVAFCDAAVRRDVAGMRAELTPKLSEKSSDRQVLAVLLLSSPLLGYDVLGYAGGPAGASVYVRLRTAGTSRRVRFVVINDRDGWRIAGVDR